VKESRVRVDAVGQETGVVRGGEVLMDLALLVGAALGID